MSDPSLFQKLRDRIAVTHDRVMNHKTVLGIGTGTLPEPNFRFYIEQDYQFLTRYVQVLALAVASSDDLVTTARLSELLHNTMAVEIDALRNLYERFGGNPAQLDNLERAPTCAAYTNHLLAVAGERNLLLTLAAILPCQWGYREIGRSLQSAGFPDDERFAAWISEYASDEYAELVDWIVERFDRLALESSAGVRSRAGDVFELSAEYELCFWEMAWNCEAWDHNCC